MPTSYDVGIWKIEKYKGIRVTSYTVRWRVERREWKKAFRGKALAESFWSSLVAAARAGEAFDIDTGRPVSMGRASRVMSWYEFACAYVDMKWPHVAATTRRTHAEALTTVTTAMFANQRGKPADKLIRSALSRWGFNTLKRDAPDCPSEVREALRWVARHTRPVSALAEPAVLRRVLDGLTVTLDGARAAPTVVNRKRAVLNTALGYAVELKLLDANPIPALRWKAPRMVHELDTRRVANPVQVRTLLNAVREQQRSGPRLVAYFGCIYFAAMRPEEVARLAKHNLSLPREGWGELHLEGADPHAGKDWTDAGTTRDRRRLKHRGAGATRPVPCPPELTAMLHEHLAVFGTADDGRLFVGERGGELPKLTVARAWKRARAAVFTPEVAASPLARTPYDLRHAAVSTWLAGGVPPTTVATWAGHSVEVLLRTYAKSVDGGDAAIRQRVQAALGHGTG